MASYRGHLAFSTGAAIAYGGGAIIGFGIDMPTALLAAGLTAVSGLLPDLDSDSGIPVRTLFGIASVLIPLLLLRRLMAMHVPIEQMLLILGGTHLFVRYGLSYVFKRLTVHRGMFHSVPAMLIAGLAVFLLDHDPSPFVRMYLAGGAMLGFFSHLLLDELCSVNLVGATIRLNKFAGSALKLISASWLANLTTYVILAGLTYLAALEFTGTEQSWRLWQQPVETWSPLEASEKNGGQH